MTIDTSPTASADGDTDPRPAKRRITATDLGLDVAGGRDPVLFRWLAACLLFAARVPQERAAAAFRALDAQRLLTPTKLAAADCQLLSDVLTGARYVRFDAQKAHELIKLGRDVRERYGGRLSRLAHEGDTTVDVSRRLQEFTGIGPVAAGIFLRDVPW